MLDQLHEASVYCCAYSPSGDLIATGSNDKLIKFLRRETGLESDEPVLRITGEMAQHQGTVRKLAFLPQSTRLVSGGGELHCYLTEVETEQVVATLSFGFLII